MALVPFPGPQSGAARAPDAQPEDDDAGKMSFLEHLDELRKRIIHAVCGVAAGVVLAFIFIQRIVDFIYKPINALLPPGSRFIYTEPGEAFGLYIQIALIAGLILAGPWVMYQVWLFIAPGLYQNEKKFAVPFVALTSVGLLGGALFNHYVVFKWIMKFFGTFSDDTVQFMPRIEPVFNLYMKMLLGMALVFQMPTLAFFLAKMQVLTARFLIKNVKYAILIIFVAAAVLTPSGDVASQTLFALPMIGLYIISIGIAWMFGRRTGKAEPVA